MNKEKVVIKAFISNFWKIKQKQHLGIIKDTHKYAHNEYFYDAKIINEL